MKDKKKSAIESLFKCKCPVCRTGNLFLYTNPYRLKEMAKMPDICPVCGLSFTQELGFYWGAMYVSYLLTVFISVINFIPFYLIWGWLTWEFLIVNTLILFILFPLMFRYSRVIWLYLFGNYNLIERTN